MLSFAVILLSWTLCFIEKTECPRHRKPWHWLTDKEKKLYLRAINLLNQNEVLATFTDTHSYGKNENQAHTNGAFLPWHRYFLWELETQIRALGDEFKCVSLPYWDWTRDANKEPYSNLYDPDKETVNFIFFNVLGLF